MQPAVDDLRQAEELSDDIFPRIEPAVSDRGHGSVYRPGKVISLARPCEFLPTAQSNWRSPIISGSSRLRNPGCCCGTIAVENRPFHSLTLNERYGDLSAVIGSDAWCETTISKILS